MCFVSGADIQFFRSHRLDVCLVQNHPIALYVYPYYPISPTNLANQRNRNSVFLPASDIPRFVGEGNVDLGITGQDVIREAQMSPHITEVLKLGFGKCKLQIQVPELGKYQSVEALAGKRIATSFEYIAGEYFTQLDKQVGLQDGSGTKIEYVGGSVEAACALGLADGIGTFLSVSFSKSYILDTDAITRLFPFFL